METEDNIDIKDTTTIKYLGSLFKSSGLSKEEVLNVSRIQQARKQQK